MSEYCPKCGETISEDDSRLCAQCQTQELTAEPTNPDVVKTKAAIRAARGED